MAAAQAGGATRHRVEVGREPFDGPAGRALVAELMADLDVRYAGDGAGDGDAPEVVATYTVQPEQVTPPAGVFLVARLDGEAVGCGALRRIVGGPPDVGEIKRMYTVPSARARCPPTRS